MVAKKKITPEILAQMEALFVKAYFTCSMIGKRYDLSRQSVSSALREIGIDTSRRRISVPCRHCGNQIAKTRAEVRKHDNHFCDSDCYGKYLSDPETQDLNMELRVAREKALNFMTVEKLSLSSIYLTDDGDALVFASREDLLEWSRTGFKMKSFSLNKGNYINVARQETG